MKLTAEQIAKLREIIDSCNNDGVDVRCYSGRGMNGRECLGFVASSEACSKLIAVIVEELMSDVFDTVDNANDDPKILEITSNVYSDAQAIAKMILRGQRMDSMGKSDIVMYFPDISWEEYSPKEEVASDLEGEDVIGGDKEA